MQLAQAYPLAVVARVVGCPRSTLYAPARPRSQPTALQAALLEIVAEWPTLYLGGGVVNGHDRS